MKRSVYTVVRCNTGFGRPPVFYQLFVEIQKLSWSIIERVNKLHRSCYIWIPTHTVYVQRIATFKLTSKYAFMKDSQFVFFMKHLQFVFFFKFALQYSYNQNLRLQILCVSDSSIAITELKSGNSLQTSCQYFSCFNRRVTDIEVSCFWSEVLFQYMMRLLFY